MILYMLFLIILLPTPFLFFLFMYTTIEKKAKRIVELLPGDAIK